MSGKIDYDELDRAVSQASRAQSRAKTTTAKSAAQHSATAKTSYQPHTRYMDFIAKPRRKSVAASQPKEEIQVKTKSAPNAVEPEAPRRVARFAPAEAGMPNYRVANSHPATKPHSIPTKPVAQPAPTPAVKPVAHVAKPISAVKPVARIAKPTPAIKTPAQPVTRPTMRVASVKPVAEPATTTKPAVAPKTALSESEKIQAKNTAAAADAAAKALEKAPSSPNANNYSLGVRSPFIRNDAKVEKRPLGAGSDYVQDDKVGKNSYAAKAQPTGKAEDKKKTKVVGNKKQKSNGWIWPLIVILIIAAGGGLGYLAYRILENAL